MSRVSILLPFRDAAETLPAALGSIRRQTLDDWECVLVDDGSRDGSAAAADAAIAADARIRVVRRAPGGLVAALNAGIAHCAAPLIARMDADDIMHRKRLAAQVAALQREPALDGVGCHVRIFPRALLSDGMRDYEAWLGSIDGEAAIRRDAFVESPLVHPTLMIRTQVLARFGYRNVGWPEDYDLVLRLLAAGCRLGVLPRRLLCWRDGPGRLTRRDGAYALDRIVSCKAHHLSQTFLSGASEYILWGYGGTGRALWRSLREHAKRPALIVDVHEGRVGMRIHGAPVVAPHDIPPPGRLPLLASVAGPGPRQEIRAFLEGRGWVDGRDFVCAA